MGYRYGNGCFLNTLAFYRELRVDTRSPKPRTQEPGAGICFWLSITFSVLVFDKINTMPLAFAPIL